MVESNAPACAGVPLIRPEVRWMSRPGGSPLEEYVTAPGPGIGHTKGAPTRPPVSAGLVMSGLASSSAFSAAISLRVEDAREDVDAADGAAADVAAVVLEEAHGVRAADHAVAAGVGQGQTQHAVAVEVHLAGGVVRDGDHVPGVVGQADRRLAAVGIELQLAIVNVESLVNAVAEINQAPPPAHAVEPEQDGHRVELVREHAQGGLELESGVVREVQHPPRRAPHGRAWRSSGRSRCWSGPAACRWSCGGCPRSDRAHAASRG